MFGAPCGAIGAGTIGRGFKGEFARFQMIPGEYSYETVPSDAFHVCVKEEGSGKVLFSSVLASKRSGRAFKGWEYNVRDEDISYRALYPRAWFTYDLPEVNLKLFCEQISPFIPQDYQDSSLPVCVFKWKVQKMNPDDNRKLKVIIAFSFQSGWGKRQKWLRARTRGFQGGRLIHQSVRGLRLTYGIYAQNGQALPDFRPGAGDGRGFIRAIEEDQSEEVKDTSSSGRPVGIGVKVLVNEGQEAIMALCWDMPRIKFKSGARTWTRWYTKFFHSGQLDEESSAEALLKHAIGQVDVWRERIRQWQAPTLSDESLPGWLKSCVFNELYYIADGGSQWLVLDEVDDTLDEEDPRRRFGRFCYLESHE